VDYLEEYLNRLNDSTLKSIDEVDKMIEKMIQTLKVAVERAELAHIQNAQKELINVLADKCQDLVDNLLKLYDHRNKLIEAIIL